MNLTQSLPITSKCKLCSHERKQRRMLLAAGGFLAGTFLGRRTLAIAQKHPLWSSEVTIYTQGEWRCIISNGIPNHGAVPPAGSLLNGQA